MQRRFLENFLRGFCLESITPGVPKNVRLHAELPSGKWTFFGTTCRSGTFHYT